MTEKMLPQLFEAEQGVLGSILYMPGTISLIADSLKPDDFFYRSYRHPEIYQAMKRLYERESPIDMVTIIDQLSQREITTIQDVPVLRYLSRLWDLALETGPNTEEHARIVSNYAMKRRLREVAGQIAMLSQEEENAQVALEKSEQLIYQLSEGLAVDDLVPLPTVLSDFMREMDKREEQYGKVVGIPTGFTDLDYLLGGLQPQELIILGGRPGEGKTSLLLNILYNFIYKESCNVAFFSLEMSRNDLARRLVSMDTGIDSQILRTRTMDSDQWDKIAKSLGKLSDDHIFIDETGDQSLASVRTKARRHKMKHSLDLIVVDYLQMMHTDVDVKNGNRREEIDKISRGLKQIAKELHVPVLALASLSRAVEGRADKRPQLYDLRESGSIESDADVVMFISRRRDREGYSLINIEKHRNGPVGDVMLKFNPQLTKFSDAPEEAYV